MTLPKNVFWAVQPGTKAMISNLWTRKGVVLVAAIVTFTCVAALLSVNLASPDPISSAALGADWQCSRIAFVLTTCTPPVRNVGAGPPTAYDLSTSPAAGSRRLQHSLQ